MLAFIVRRLALSVLALLGVLVIMFLLMRAAPVDPARQYAGMRATEEQLTEVRHELGLDRSVPVQIGTYIKNFFTGNWGDSLISKHPVIDDVGKTLPYTLELVFLSMLLTVVIGIPLGVVSAEKKDKLPDHASRVLAVGLISIPTFWLALALQYIFSGKLHLLPLSGAGSIQVVLSHPIDKVTGFPLLDALLTGNFKALLDHARYLILPVIALTGMSLGALQRITRSSMVETLSEEYIVAKRSYGLAERTVLYRHALKNTTGPIVTTVAVFVAVLIVNTFLIESIFAWPGLGAYIATGVATLDYPVIMAVTLISAVAFLIMNALADVLLAIDPRVRLRG